MVINVFVVTNHMVLKQVTTNIKVQTHQPLMSGSPIQQLPQVQVPAFYFRESHTIKILGLPMYI